MSFELILITVQKWHQDDPVLQQQNLESLGSVALPLFRKGHNPMIGEWVALLLIRLVGSNQPGDAASEEIQYPVAHRLPGLEEVPNA